MADTMDSKSIAREGVWVRLPPPVIFTPFLCFLKKHVFIVVMVLRAAGVAGRNNRERR